ELSSGATRSLVLPVAADAWRQMLPSGLSRQAPAAGGGWPNEIFGNAKKRAAKAAPSRRNCWSGLVVEPVVALDVQRNVHAVCRLGLAAEGDVKVDFVVGQRGRTQVDVIDRIALVQHQAGTVEVVANAVDDEVGDRRLLVAVQAVGRRHQLAGQVEVEAAVVRKRERQHHAVDVAAALASGQE